MKSSNSPRIRVPVTILCGFLGSGKTTLLQRLLRDPQGERLLAIVNDLAALNIDAAFVATETPDSIALTNGCVCCSIQDDLAATVIASTQRSPSPTHIILECSGVAHPAKLLDLFVTTLQPWVYLNSIVGLVDLATFGDLDYPSTELAIDQAALSDLVLLNKSDLVSRAEADKVEAVLKAAQPFMQTHRTTFAEMSAEIVLGAALTARTFVPARSSGQVAHGYESASYRWCAPVLLSDLESALEVLPKSVLRGKGLFAVQGQTNAVVLQIVGKRRSLEVIDSRAPARSEATFIWSADNDIDEQVGRSMRSCMAIEVERVRTGKKAAYPKAYVSQ